MLFTSFIVSSAAGSLLYLARHQRRWQLISDYGVLRRDDYGVPAGGAVPGLFMLAVVYVVQAGVSQGD